MLRQKGSSVKRNVAPSFSVEALDLLPNEWYKTAFSFEEDRNDFRERWQGKTSSENKTELDG
jgi:hypothetical protein